MKKFSWMLAAILTCGLATTVFTSCSSSSDDSSTPAATFSTIQVVCTAETTQSSLDALNMKVYYPDNTATTTVESMTGTTWTKTIEIPASKAPCTVECYMTVTPKDAEGKTSNLTFGKGCKMTVSTLDSKGNSISLILSSNPISTTVVEDGIALSEFAKNTNSAERKITISIDKNGNLTEK